MAATLVKASPFNIILLCIFFFTNVVPSWSKSGVRLIRRDSPLSPFYNPHATLSDLATASVKRTIERSDFFGSLQDKDEHSSSSQYPQGDAQSRLRPGKSEYLMEFQIGNPPQPVYGIADTASSLTWVQCVPCSGCPTKRPLFDPSASLTYETIDCYNPTCVNLNLAFCPKNQIDCHWKIGYGGGASSSGELAFETFIFGNSVENQTFRDIPFGCGHEATAVPDDGTGIVGLNRNPVSLVSRLKVSKFSYCLVPPNDDTSGSWLHLGSEATISGGTTGIISVPGKADLYYYVNLEGISVGRDRLPIDPETFRVRNGRGGVVVDSGATVISLKRPAYDVVVKGVQERVEGLKRVIRPKEELELCYDATYTELEDKAPPIIFHFTGVNVALTTLGAFFVVDFNVWCLGVVPHARISIFGNRAQSNYIVGYDLERNLISFAPADCATF